MTKEKKGNDQKKNPVEPIEPSKDVFQQEVVVSLSNLRAMQFIEVFIRKRRGALKKLADFDKKDGPSEN